MELQECGIGKSLGYKFDINIPATVNRFSPKFQKAQKWLDNEVLKDCGPYVPFRTGTLEGSGIRGTVIGSGDINYNAPYANSCYYALERNFSHAKHPQATAQWFEKAKAVKQKNWKDGTEKIVRE